MKPISAIVLYVLVGVCSEAYGEELGSLMGTAHRDGSYNLNAEFGIEQWEDGKLTTHRRQQWFLNCDYPEFLTKAPKTWCSLDRVVIDEGLTQHSGAMIKSHQHHFSDGTLKLVRADWPRGVLDFTVVHRDKSTIEVMLRMKIKDGLIHLDSFKGTGIARGLLSNTMTTIEYRIPRYTYMLSVPLEMRGLRSASDKEWDEMLATLSKEDRKSWEDFRAKMLNVCELNKGPDGELLQKAIPNYEARTLSDLTPEEKRRLAAVMADEWAKDLAKCLATTKISPAGQKKIIGLMRKQLASSLELGGSRKPAEKAVP